MQAGKTNIQMLHDFVQEGFYRVPNPRVTTTYANYVNDPVAEIINHLKITQGIGGMNVTYVAIGFVFGSLMADFSSTPAGRGMIEHLIQSLREAKSPLESVNQFIQNLKNEGKIQ